MSQWITRQLGFDRYSEVPVADPTDVHHVPSGRYAAILAGVGSRHGDHHGHSHGDHGHSHSGGGGCQQDDGNSNNTTVTFEGACGSGDLAAVITMWAQGVTIPGRRQPYGGSEAPPLHWAAMKGHLPVMKFLIDKGADVHATTSDQQTALHWAASEGRYEAIDALLALGARPEDTDARGFNTYFGAVQTTNYALLVRLLDHQPIDPDTRDGEGHTLLHWAAYRGSLVLCTFLVEAHKVAVDAVDSQRRTALIWAAREGFDDVCAYLLSKGSRAAHQDIEGLSALDHAKERQQRHVVHVLQGLPRAPKASGTLTLMVQDRAALASSLFGVSYVMIAFAFMHVFPSIFSQFVLGLYWIKNMMWSSIYKVPANFKNRKPTKGDFAEIMAMSGIPRDFAEAVRGMDHILRGREPGNLLGFLTLLAVQHISLGVAQIDLTAWYWLLLGVVLLSLVLVKYLWARDVIPNGSVLPPDAPSIRAVRDKKYHLLQCRVIDQEKQIRVPLRAFYSVEVDSVLKQYDSYSCLLDAPISESNLRWFALFLIAFTALQWHIFSHVWSTLSQRLCDSHSSSALYGFVFHAMPCALKPVDSSWVAFLMPSSLNAAGIWIVHYSLVTAVMGFIVTARVLYPVCLGCTRKELMNPTAPTTDGVMVPIVRNGRCIFSEGGMFTNLMLLFAGRFGERWKGLLSVPAPPAL